MIEQQAQVTQIQGNQVWLSVQRQQGCQSCHLSQGCGTSSLGKLMGMRNMQLTLPNSLNLKLGDRAVVGIPDRSYLLASVLIYLFPLLLMFLVAGITDALWQLEWLTVVSSIATLIGGLMVAGKLSKNRYASALQPKLIRQIW